MRLFLALLQCDVEDDSDSITILSPIIIPAGSLEAAEAIAGEVSELLGLGVEAVRELESKAGFALSKIGSELREVLFQSDAPS